MGFLEDLKNGDTKSIIIVIFGILLFNLYYCLSTKHTKEPMADLSSDIRQAVRQVYLADVQAIRNLSEVATKMQKDGYTIAGDLTVTGKFNYLPRGTIVAFNSSTAPAGWAICDGNNNTPDLRGRFILGSGKGYDLTERKLGVTGGAETVVLTESQMPKHNHSGDIQLNSYYSEMLIYGRDNMTLPTKDKARSLEKWGSYTTDSKGESKAHENMPPFYVLTYIMKL